MTERIGAADRTGDTALLAFLALIVGAIAMGASPIFVRYAEVGPLTSAFWRVCLALPVLWLWARLEPHKRPIAQADRGALISVLLAGVLFAGDLIFWHLAIMNTSVANATFLATLAPVWVVLGSGMFLGEPVDRKTLAGLALGLLGMSFLIGGTLRLNPGNLDGDLFGVATSFFFGCYFIAVRRARRAFPSGQTLYLSSIVTAAVLLAFATVFETQMWPLSIVGLSALLALALVSHAGGQGLLAIALGYLPAAFSALVIFVEAVAAAALGWLILGEALALTQFLGALAIFTGIGIAKPRRAS